MQHANSGPIHIDLTRLDLGRFGVNLFFVIWGYLMCATTACRAPADAVLGCAAPVGLSGWRYDTTSGKLAKIPDERGVRKQVRSRRKHLARFVLIGLYSGTRHMAMVRARWTASAQEPHVDTERGLLFRKGL
jgi:hypothetical protein